MKGNSTTDFKLMIGSSFIYVLMHGIDMECFEFFIPFLTFLKLFLSLLPPSSSSSSSLNPFDQKTRPALLPLSTSRSLFSLPPSRAMQFASLVVDQRGDPSQTLTSSQTRPGEYDGSDCFFLPPRASRTSFARSLQQQQQQQPPLQHPQPLHMIQNR